MPPSRPQTSRRRHASGPLRRGSIFPPAATSPDRGHERRRPRVQLRPLRTDSKLTYSKLTFALRPSAELSASTDCTTPRVIFHLDSPGSAAPVHSLAMHGLRGKGVGELPPSFPNRVWLNPHFGGWSRPKPAIRFRTKYSWRCQPVIGMRAGGIQRGGS